MAKSKTPTKVSELTFDDKNFNKGNPFGEGLIEKSFSKFGAGRSILLDKNNRIIAGNKSTQKFAEGGGEKIIVVETDGNTLVAVKRTDIDLDTPQGREMALADNMAASKNITIDAELVTAELTEAVAVEWGVETGTKLEAEEDDFDVPEGGIETDIVLGDLFEIGQHRLLCGDSTDSDAVAKLMDGGKADMVFTDPPYGVDFVGIKGTMYQNGKKKGKDSYEAIKNDDLKNESLTDLFYESISNAIINTKSNSAFYIFFGINKSKETIEAISNLDLEIRNWLIWDKGNVGFHAMGAQYKPNYESFLYCFKKGSPPNWIGNQQQQTIWRHSLERIGLHPTMKPISLISQAIQNHDALLLLDLFLGSGSTMVAAHQLNRKCYGMELDPKYCQVIVDRMIKLDPTLVIKKNGVLLETKVAA